MCIRDRHGMAVVDVGQRGGVLAPVVAAAQLAQDLADAPAILEDGGVEGQGQVMGLHVHDLPERGDEALRPAAHEGAREARGHAQAGADVYKRQG